MSNRLVRFGVIGAGWFASRRHLPDMEKHPNVEIAAICRRDPAALSRLANHFSPGATFTDWRAMLDAGVLDAVLIASPNALHFEEAEAALGLGLHVLVEKPLATEVLDARRLQAIAAEKGLILSTALNPPFWSHCHYARRAISSGRLGAIETASVLFTGNAEYVFGDAAKPDGLPGIVEPTLYRGDPELCGGGYFIDGASHLISELVWVTGRRVARIHAEMDRLPSDRAATATLVMEDGTPATLTSIGNSRLPGRRVRNVFAGASGTITVDGFDFRTVFTPRYGDPEAFAEAELAPVSGPVANFTDAILGRDELHSPPDHGVHVVEVVAAAYESARTGRTIEIAG